ncbi:hypothetical protein C2G38_2180443 [Gigaspora rosea]|uniref:Uncharacterized protein n=1 Tax=Gigaspora rosea TaxID=44941 RepID=A0A397VDA3_9GLOM|nr:hypothetical protein C2G38_2180443 [Gigaspora rosea]
MKLERKTMKLEVCITWSTPKMKLSTKKENQITILEEKMSSLQVKYDDSRNRSTKVVKENLELEKKYINLENTNKMLISLIDRGNKDEDEEDKNEEERNLWREEIVYFERDHIEMFDDDL